jgi:hypothetical protein
MPCPSRNVASVLATPRPGQLDPLAPIGFVHGFMHETP